MPRELASPPAVAHALLGPALGLRRGEQLVVVSWNHTLPWASAAVAEARRLGARPVLLLEDESAFWRGIDLARSTASWATLPRTVRASLREADALLYFPGPADRPRLRGLPSDLLTPLLGQEELWSAPLAAGATRGVSCLLGYASDAEAEFWDVPGATWRSQLIRAISEADYATIAAAARRASRLLTNGHEVTIRSDEGTDLRLRLKGRRPWIDDGRAGPAPRPKIHALATAPAGSVLVAIDERSAAGMTVANRPSYLAGGRVEGGQWELEDGKLRSYWYARGAETFEEEFSLAPKGRETVGLLSLGLNGALPPGVPRAEDEEEGAVTLAVGGNSSYGGSNRCSYLSWITVGGASVAVDGVPLCDRGKLL